MKHKIFSSMISTTSMIALITVLSMMLLFFPFMEDEILEELKQQASLIEEGIELDEERYLDGIDDEERRITLINEDGTVVYDNDTNVGSLDNHLNREEIQQAMENGSGSSIRFSDTLTQRTINYAKKLEDGRILRISIAQNYVLAMLSWLITPTMIIIAAIVFLSAVLSKKVSDSVLKPLYDLDPEKPEDAEIYEEIRPLTTRIAYQNRKLKEKLYDEMKQKQKIQNEFTTNMTHELKTPLTSISGFAELMMNDDIDEDTVKDFSNSIHDEAARLIDIVNDIIKVTELEEREGSYSFEECSLREISDDVVKRLGFSAKRKKINLIVSGEAETYCVRDIVFEMIYNLCDNAIKYNAEGGNVFITLSEDDDGAHLSVKDSGIGIPKEDQDRIFERFYMVDKSHSKEIGGTGLGLSIVHQGAMLHGATINIDSQENVGTEITMNFPG